jgi:succinate-semialdehyde dehydrogenase/glutarate-semialdehyde dehydrogenase
MTQEMGKPISESRGEVKYAAAFVEWYAEEAKRAYGDIVPNRTPPTSALLATPATGWSGLRCHAVEFPGRPW